MIRSDALSIMENSAQLKALPNHTCEEFKLEYSLFHRQAADWIEHYQGGQTLNSEVMFKSLQQNSDRLLTMLNLFEETKDVEFDVQQGSKRKVLVVDDNEMITLSLQLILDDAGYLVEVCNRSSEAIEKLTQFKPHLLISDIFMPDINGVKLIADAQQKFPYLQIIGMSGGTEKSFDILKDASLAGASLVMTKPINRDQLLENLRSLIG